MAKPAALFKLTHRRVCAAAGGIAGAIGRQIQSTQRATFIRHLCGWPGIPLEFICAHAHIDDRDIQARDIRARDLQVIVRKTRPNARKGSLKIDNKGETSMTIRPVVPGHLDGKFIERTSTVLSRGILWSSLAICVLAALFYGIASWFAGS